MEERYAIPFFEGSFYGIGDTSDALRQISRLLVARVGPADLPERAEALIAREEARVWARLESFKARLKGKRVLLFTGGVKSWSLVAALQEVGLEIVGTSMRKSTATDRQKVIEIMGTDAHVFDELPPREMYRQLKEARADVMLSGGRSQFVALKAKVPWVEINQERHHPYAGYDGMVNLVAQIDRTLHNPIWAQLRQPAPWEADDWLDGWSGEASAASCSSGSAGAAAREVCHG
jgi:nitrogenase molybdenum-cofactor synthesis protein NifE